MKPNLLLAWGFGLVASLALGDVIWRLAAGTADDLRLVFAATPVLAWAVALMLGRAQMPGQAQAPAPAGRGAPPATLVEALKARGLFGGHARYRVPLFLVLGPSGMGKSMLLQRSGLDLDPSQQEDGLVWWLSSEAIFVEATTGQVEADHLTEALARFRPERPASGVILAVSPADLTLADALERKQMGEAIARTLATMETRAGVRPPVYLVLTKMDLAPGFAESFDMLEPGEREQPWGFSFPPTYAQTVATEDAVAVFRSGIRNLVDAMRTRLMESLSRIDEPLRGGRLLNFGAQIASLDPIVDTVLKEILPAGRAQTRGAYLRGVFFASSMQDALVIDQLLPEMSARYAMPRSGMLPPDLTTEHAAEGFFIKGLWREAVLPEAGLAIGPATRWYRRRGVAVAAAAAVLILAAAGVFALSSAFRTSQDRLASFERALSSDDPAVLRMTADRIDALAAAAVAVDRLQDLRIGEADSGLWPGLTGERRLSQAASAAYWHGLRNSLLPHLVAQMSADLVDTRARPEALTERIAAADPQAPRHVPSLQAWIEAVAAKVDGRAAHDAVLAQAPRAFALRDAAVPAPVYLDTARRLVALKEATP